MTNAIKRRIDRAVQLGQAKSVRTGKPHFVVSLDDGGEFGERSIISVGEDYLNADEFFAFDGVILVEIDSAGNVAEDYLTR